MMTSRMKQQVCDDAVTWEDFKEALTTSVVQDRSQSGSTERMIREIPVPEGYELAFYTLRKLDGGHLEYFMIPPNSNDEHVQAMPITPRDNGLNHNHMSTQQNYHITKHDGYGTVPHLPQQERSDREPSVATALRRAHARSDGYSVVCGVYSPEISAPVTSENRGKGDFYCPRCGSNYTRPYSVKDHFFYCITKHGNPRALRFTDHPSMAQTEAAIQRRNQGVVGQEQVQEMSDALYVGPILCKVPNGPGPLDVLSLQESMFWLLTHNRAHTSLRVTQEREMSEDNTHIKTEFVFGAE